MPRDRAAFAPPPPGARFHIRTFGCKTNQYEAEGLRSALESAGFVSSDTPGDCAIHVLNTCAVTHRADATCRNALRALRRANPAAVLVLTGCAADLDQEWTQKIAPPVLRLRNAEKDGLAALLAGGVAGEALPTEDSRFAFRPARFAGHTRAFVKIHDGCDNRCAYCTIPDARGTPASRPLEPIREEARRLVDHGHRELVLTGINIGAYRGEDGETLATVVRAVGATPGLVRLRLGSVEPQTVTEALLHALAETETACPHLHLPLQSGDDGILHAMNRPYGAAAFLRTVERIREVLDRPAITTDLLTGFPGEDEAAFARTLETVRRAAFARSHLFPFSPRPGTPAASLPRRVPQRVVKERMDRLRAITDASARAFSSSFLGRTVRIQVESNRNEAAEGYTDRYLRARTTARGVREGEFLDLHISATEGVLLLGAPPRPF